MKTNNPIPCPKCGSKVTAYGTACYPEDGIRIGCADNFCDFYMDIKCSTRKPELTRDIATQMYNLFCGQKNG
jgi:hypothetical protein